MAESALEPTLQLASTLRPITRCELHLVQVIASPGAASSRWKFQQIINTEQGEQAMLAAEDYLQTVITRLKQGPLASQDVFFTTAAVCAAEVGEAIVQHVEHTQSIIEGEYTDLIAMTTHGRSGAQRVLLGSVAEEVLSIATCPVLIIRSARQSEQGESAYEEPSASHLP